MSYSEDYVKQLETIIRRFLEPLTDIPYSLAIRVLTGFEVLKFDPLRNERTLNLLKKAAQMAGEKACEEGVKAPRPNEAGNKMEKFILEALGTVGLEARVPRTKSGKVKTSGFPDIEITTESGETIYLECKTYSVSSKNQTFRTFYFSPSRDPKITKNAYHLLLSYELVELASKPERIFAPTSWQLYTLEDLKVQVKHEFNASNKDLYRKEFLLAEGKINRHGNW